MPTDQRGQTSRPPQQRPQQARTPEVLSGPPALLTNLPAVTGIHRSVDTLRAALNDVAPKVHLLSPTVDPAYVPEFHEVAIRLVVVDPRDESGEVYKLPGAKDDERALTKVALDKIAAAAGISWDPVRSGRLDDGSDPAYCHYRAVGYVRDLDGSRRTLSGEKEIDLRDGNPSIYTDDPTKMAREWANGRYTDQIKNRGFVKGWSAQRVGEARQHILAMAESKAKNRVVRFLGVKQKYRVAELQAKPFAVLALVLTGTSSDPALERMAKERMLDAALATSRELYPATVRQGRLEMKPEPPPDPVVERHAPPPITDARQPDPDDVIEIDPEDDCACPDGPAGQHVEGCRFFEDSQ